MTNAKFYQDNLVEILESIKSEFEDAFEEEEKTENIEFFNSGLRCGMSIVNRYLDAAKKVQNIQNKGE